MLSEVLSTVQIILNIITIILLIKLLREYRKDKEE